MSDPPVARIEPPAFLATPAAAAVLAALPGSRAVGGAVMGWKTTLPEAG